MSRADYQLIMDGVVFSGPNAPKQKPITHLSNGMEIKLGGGKRRKEQTTKKE